MSSFYPEDRRIHDLRIFAAGGAQLVGSSDTVQFRVHAFGTQASNVVEIRDSSDVPVVIITRTGNVVVNGLSANSVSVSESAALNNVAISGALSGTTGSKVLTTDGAQSVSNKIVTASTIDSTPIGATTPSTGSFTNVAANIATANYVLVQNLLQAGSLKSFGPVILTDNSNSSFANLSYVGSYNVDLNIPAQNGTLLVAEASQTVSNKAVTASTIDSTPIGATTPSTGSFTDVAISGTLSGATGSKVVITDAVQSVSNKSLVALNSNIGINGSDVTFKLNGNKGFAVSTNPANDNYTSYIFCHATADRTYDFPDASGTFTLNGVAQSVSNKTVTASTIDSTPVGATTPSTGSFTNVAISGALSGTTGSKVLTTDGAQSVSNKTVTASTINSTPVGATTPSTGAFTTGSFTGTTSFASGTSINSGGALVVNTDYTIKKDPVGGSLQFSSASGTITAPSGTGTLALGVSSSFSNGTLAEFGGAGSEWTPASGIGMSFARSGNVATFSLNTQLSAASATGSYLALKNGAGADPNPSAPANSLEFYVPGVYNGTQTQVWVQVNNNGSIVIRPNPFGGFTGGCSVYKFAVSYPLN
jgi:hypothetical protein